MQKRFEACASRYITAVRWLPGPVLSKHFSLIHNQLPPWIFLWGRIWQFPGHCWKDSLGLWCGPSPGFETYVSIIILCFLSINILIFGCYFILSSFGRSSLFWRATVFMYITEIQLSFHHGFVSTGVCGSLWPFLV